MLDFEDPRAVAEAALVFQKVEFPEAGEYRVQLYAGDEPLLERRILLVNMERGNG